MLAAHTWEHVLVAFSVAAILAPFSYYAGLGARLLRLPQITGYLVSGIVCGPYLLGILSQESLLDLNIVEGACLSIIGLAAGAELDWPSLSRSRKQVLGITAGVCIMSWVLCYGALDWLGLSFPLLPNMDSAHLTAVATLGATLMMTRSPASAIAVLKEVDGRGPFCSLVMAVVVVKDVVVIVAFALNMELIRAIILPASLGAGNTISMVNITLPLVSVLLSMALGGFGGLMLGAMLRIGPGTPVSAGSGGIMAGAGRVQAGGLPVSAHEVHSGGRTRMFAVLALSTGVFQMAHYFEAEPLLACVTMGMVVVNRRHDRAEKDKEEVHAVVTQIMSLTNVAFFGLAGASLKLSALKDMLWPSLVIAAVRLVAIWLGSWMGCASTATLPEFRRVFWASMVTQAGVAMGLARLAGTRFPDWGPHFQTFMMSIILINLLVGPPLFRWALIRVGEVRTTMGGSMVAVGGAKVGLEMAAEGMKVVVGTGQEPADRDQ